MVKFGPGRLSCMPLKIFDLPDLKEFRVDPFPFRRVRVTNLVW